MAACLFSSVFVMTFGMALVRRTGRQRQDVRRSLGDDAVAVNKFAK